MKKHIQLIRNIIRSSGFDIIRYHPQSRGHCPFHDMNFFLHGIDRHMIFDVGANIGQSVDDFRTMFPQASIHSFEPSPKTYEQLRKHCHDMTMVKTWNLGIGARSTILPFHENTHPRMSSFLIPGKSAWWGETERTINVNVITLDDFAREQGIDLIHVLKIDTQGFDYEVLKGAEGLMKADRIALIYCEVIFSEMYLGLPPFHELLGFLHKNNYSLITFYNYFYQEDLLGWVDALFINNNFNRKRLHLV